MKRWSKLAKRLYELVDESIDFKLHCTVYRMQSRHGSTDLPRYFITLAGEIIFDYPKDFVLKSSGVKSLAQGGAHLAKFYPYDSGVIEAAKSFGASKTQIIFRVMFVEALPSIIGAITLTLIVIIGFTAMAGTVGGGGLGDVAIRYGFQRFRPDIMAYTVVILIVLVQIIQSIGNLFYKITKK